MAQPAQPAQPGQLAGLAHPAQPARPVGLLQSQPLTATSSSERSRFGWFVLSIQFFGFGSKTVWLPVRGSVPGVPGPIGNITRENHSLTSPSSPPKSRGSENNDRAFY